MPVWRLFIATRRGLNALRSGARQCAADEERATQQQAEARVPFCAAAHSTHAAYGALARVAAKRHREMARWSPRRRCTLTWTIPLDAASMNGGASPAGSRNCAYTCCSSPHRIRHCLTGPARSCAKTSMQRYRGTLRLHEVRTCHRCCAAQMRGSSGLVACIGMLWVHGVGGVSGVKAVPGNIAS
jgi:hypothetical protein